MAIELDLQVAVESDGLPSGDNFERWVAAALDGREDAELTIRVVGREESRMLNHTYRGKDSETNVLSFIAEVPEGIGLALLGDVVICAPRVEEESLAQAKDLHAHWAHLTVHGVLHLLGYDHQQDDDAEEMEALETTILASLGIPDPYSGPVDS